MFRFCLLAIAGLIATSGTASAQYYNYSGYHHSYSYSYPQQNYGHRGYGAVQQVQYLVPVTYRVPIFIRRPCVVQQPVIQPIAPQPACNGCK